MHSFRRLFYGLIPVSALLVSVAAKADDSIRAITEEFVLGVLSAHDSAGSASTLTDDELRDLAQERARALVENVRSQPHTILGVAIPDSIFNLIDTSLLGYVEEYSELEGLLTSTFVEHADFSREYQIALHPTGTSDTVFLHFDRPMPALPVGHLVRIRGILLPRVNEETAGSARHMVLRSDDDALEVISGADPVTAPLPVGVQRMGVFVVGFNDGPALPDDSTYEKEWRQIQDLVRRHSNGRAWLSIEHIDQVELRTGQTCDTGQAHQDLGQSLAQSGRSLEDYDRVLVVLPSLECGWRTQTTFPGSPTVVFASGQPDTKLLLRAFLHGLGMPGDQVRSCHFDTIHSECQEGSGPEPEYLRGVNAVAISPFHKERLGWMDVNQANGIRAVAGSGSYRIFASDYINRDRWMALKLERPAPLLELDTTYYLEYRTRRTVDGERLRPEVVVYILSGSRVTGVLNLTSPDPVPAELRDAIAVSAGRFVDHAAGVEIDIVNAHPWAVDLDIFFDPTSCVPATPDIEIDPRETPYLSADSTAQFSLAIASRNSEHCGPARPGLSLQLPDGWSGQQVPEMPMLEPGETVQLEVSVSIPPGEGPGFRDLEWILQGEWPIDASRSTKVFVLPSISSGDSGRMPEDEPLPGANNTISVSSQSQLLSAVLSASPGDHIVLQNGSYGNVKLTRDFPENNRLVIRARNLLGATFGSITFEGDGYIVSGIKGKSVRVVANDIRVTRCQLQGAPSSVNVNIGPYDSKGPTVEDTLVDHCDISNYTWRSVNLAQDRKNSVRRPILARNWFHHGLDREQTIGGVTVGLFSTIAFGSENAYREDPVSGIVRFNYFGPVMEDGDHVHNKTSGNIYAFNRVDTTGAPGHRLFGNRFGLNNHFIGNYMPNQRSHGYDSGGRHYGNLLESVNVWGGKSAAYDDQKNNWEAVGGFHAGNRIRIAGNQGGVRIGVHDDWFCTVKNSALGLPDPQPAGGVKPARTVRGVSYPADNPNDPDVGIQIYDNSGAITYSEDSCIRWYTNVKDRSSQKAPASWKNELPAWILAITPNPTDRATQPWKIGEAMTRGDAANPTTGPFRDSSGGLL
jgi:NPCBM-associated, NEW3 domain of alpha-galactosidase